MLTAIARAFGYVPANLLEASQRDCEEDTRELKRRVTELEKQVAIRQRLENEIEYFRRTELDRIRAHSSVAESVTRLDEIVVVLQNMVREHNWQDHEDLETVAA